MGKPCPKHAAESKRRAVQLYNERGTAYAEVAREIGVDPSSLADWVRRAGVGRQGRLGGAPPQGPVPLLARLKSTHFVL